MKRLLAPLLIVALLGAGCSKKTVQTPSSAPTATDTGSSVYLPTGKSESANQQALRELRGILKSFQEARTFRSKISMVGKGGKTTGQVDVVKPDRFHGTLTLEGAPAAYEVIGIEQSMYMKIPQNGWVAISSPALARQLKESIRGSLDANEETLKSKLPDTQQVTKTRDSANNCDLYTTTLEEGTSKVQLGICARDGMPTRLEMQSGDSTVRIDYVEFNRLFTIEKPILAKTLK